VRAFTFIGGRATKTLDSMSEARAWAAKQESQGKDERRGDIPDKIFADVLVRYRDEYTVTKKSAKNETSRINSMLGNHDPLRGRVRKPDPLALVHLRDLSTKHVAEWRDRRAATGVKAATILREWAMLAGIVSTAICEWHWLKENPFADAGGVRRPTGVISREEIFKPEDIEALQMTADMRLQSDDWARIMLMVRFAIETGMRASEILVVGDDPNLVDPIRRTLRLAKTKNGTPREVPLSTRALEIWAQAKALGCPGVWGFNGTRRDELWRDLRGAAAKIRPEVARLRFHDTRHTAATRWSEKLTPQELCRMFGWSNLNQSMTYYNKPADQIALKLD